MNRRAFETPDETWKQMVIGGVGGALGFSVAESTVGGESAVLLAVATGVVALVVMVALTAAINRFG
ncbi:MULTISPECIES: hypothetical protein [Halorussus]|uniref:hypothetical protein n=1 Tax=Halorussus TaxID=1070314 RepID=UPI000E218986|nr:MULTISPECIES: hypothetical protein [Halorussus]NHN60891.1 hypothetical protein [Halorussus sp. JP-T4]